jgi:hypothetical protein
MNTDKNSIAKNDFLHDVLIILRETFEGSPEGQGSAYLDRGIGFLNSIENLSAADVSKCHGKTTIAAQTEHAKFYLDRLCEFMTGRTEAVKWEQSWLIETVNDDEWNALRDAVKKSYENVLQTIAVIEVWNQDNIGDAIAIIAHTAYHLGSIRQMAKAI